MGKNDKEIFNFRIDAKLASRLRDAIKKTENNPYPKTLTMVVERGIELACDEIEEKE